MAIHCHNDGDLATANSLAAVGEKRLQSSARNHQRYRRTLRQCRFDRSHRELHIKLDGYQLLGGRSLEQLTELSRYVYETANLQLRDHQPFVGQSRLLAKGGMHVHAVNKAAHTYEHLDPSLVGNERRILVSELSGQ